MRGSVWLTIPSARPAAEIKDRMQKWRDMGYKIALWRNGPHVLDPVAADYVIVTNQYAGWAMSINTLISDVMTLDPMANWFVGGGDDTDPDQTIRADDIGFECLWHFCNKEPFSDAATFGVMQPTGDRFGADEPWAIATYPDAPAYIDRICGSPWIGREFARRMNQGIGPLWPEYQHMHADEELQCVAQKLGVLWQRRDLTHFHNHPRRDGVARTPDFATEIYSREHWVKTETLFKGRKAAGFPGSEPIA